MSKTPPAPPVPIVFERALYLARQSAASGDAVGLLDRRLAADVIDRLSLIRRTFSTGVLICQRPEALRQALSATSKIATLKALSPARDDSLSGLGTDNDIIINLLDLHAVNDVPGQLAQMAATLKPDGLLMLALFAGETLYELRDCWLSAELEITGGVSPRVAPMIGIRELGGLLQRAGLALPVTDIDRVTLRYADAFALMREIKSLGFGNPLMGRNSRLVSQRLTLRVADLYRQKYADADGRIRATLEIGWATAWKPHPSQQQPLKPGSAKTRLADALRVPEEKL